MQRGEFIKLVEHLLGVGILLELNHNLDLAARSFIANIANGRDLLFLDKISNPLYQHGLINAKWYFGDHNTVAATLAFLDIGNGPHRHAATAGLVGLLHWCTAIHNGTSWEIWPLNVAQQVVDGGILIINQFY